MSDQPRGFLQEESGKTSFTRVSGFLFFICFVGFGAVAIWMESKGMTEAASRAAEYAFWAFAGTVAPNLLKGLIERLLGKTLAASSPSRQGGIPPSGTEPRT